MTIEIPIFGDPVKIELAPGVKLKPPAKDPKNENNPTPVKSDRWRNLYFNKNGRYGTGKYSFASEEEAKALAKRAIECWPIEDVLFGVAYVFDNGVIMRYPEFSHHMQIPWEKD